MRYEMSSTSARNMTKFDAIIVGGGPAGVSCAIWLKQLGVAPLLIEKNDRCGGLQLSNPYTNTWIATSADAMGADVAKAMHDNMLRHDVPMRLGQKAQSVEIQSERVIVSIESGERIEGRFLVLAGGVTPKTGGFANRLGMIVGPGPQIASADFSHARVAILGGGDSSFENFKFVMDRGAASATIFARSIKARAEMLEHVAPEHVVVGEYKVDVDEKTVNGEQFDQLLVLYGFEASKHSLLGLDLAMRTDGFVYTTEECLTSHDRVYAVGELARRGQPCCVIAMADGVTAAKSIQRRLEGTKKEKFIGAARRAIAIGSRIVRA